MRNGSIMQACLRQGACQGPPAKMVILISPRAGLPSACISFSHDGDGKGKLFLQTLDFAEKGLDGRLRIAVVTLDNVSRDVVRPDGDDFFSVGHIG
ncbi:hypothetical protein F3P66_08160 [Agrobacterium fabrum]|uniref:Uncharacterized protein n=1 Tax=Agrobacterium fabrum (strain C58 / ATCC 33970) TaxID=176299 RepID=Q8UG14_AGRFC|nr:hypothetical protein Atu1229 [Agrobacterium fabrum str. C58]QRM59428.1 hypothetical protein F3P66_08160 [Agrobacterium fabrum]TRB30847.1 hypothetical protein EXN51_01300 [Agrobacterium fabrum]